MKMRAFPAFVILAFVLLSTLLAQGQTATPSANAPEASQSTQPSSASPEAIAQEYVKFWNTGNFEPLAPYIGPFFMTSHGHKIVAQPAMLKKVVSTWRDSIPDLDLKIQDTIVQGDKVVLRIFFSGTYKKRMFPNTIQPIPEAPERAIRASEILIFEIKDGKIYQMWEEYDELAMRIQMGGQWVGNDRLDAQQAKEYPTSSHKSSDKEDSSSPKK